MTTTNSSAATWTPPHCPNPNCKFHNPLARGWTFQRRGHFWRQTRPHRIPRFTCKLCHRNFSSQTFATSYWLKRPELLAQVFELAVGCMANRQIARALRCAPATVDALVARLARHCLLFHRHRTADLSPPRDIVIDGFVSFEHSQYFPFEHLVAVDRQTSFILHFADAPLRRSGTMTDYQKRKRTQLESDLGRPDPKAVEEGMREVLQESLRGAGQATVRSDEHAAYPRALRGLAGEITHLRTSSRRRRDRRNELFEINSLDMFVRHSSSNHKRETVAFSKRRQASAERFAVFMVWKSFVKRRFEKRCRKTPAMLAGLVDRVLRVEDVLSQRLFPSRVVLPARWTDYYWRRVVTPVLGVNRRHELKHAV